MQNSSIYLSKLKIHYGNTVLFNDLSLDIKEGQWVEIIGKNNTGKTSLLNTLYGLHHELAGQIKILDHGLNPMSGNFSEVRRKIGFFSNSLPLLFSKTLRANLSLAYNATNQIIDLELDPFAGGLIDRFKLKDKLLRSIESMSSSEQTLSKLLRVLVIKPRLILLDSAFRNLDNNSSSLVFDILEEYCLRENATLVSCTDKNSQRGPESKQLYLIDNLGLKQISV
ncbi:MAG: ATP-binding cassette domain-containing protein [Saprospiraceae bacterium]